MPLDNNYHGNSDFRPMWYEGQSVRLIRGTESNFVDVTIKDVYDLPWHRHDFGNISADTPDLDCTHLDLGIGLLAQYRYIPRDSFYVHLQHPAGTDQYRTQASSKGDAGAGWFVPQYDIEGEPWDAHDYRLWAASEFFVFERETPRFDIYPVSPISGGIAAHIDFYGIGFALKRFVSKGPGDEPPVSKWISGRPPGEVI